MRLTGLSAALLCMSVCMLLVTSCKKDDKEVEDGVLNNFALVEKTFSDVQSIADQAESAGTLVTYRNSGHTLLSSCATVTNDTASSTRILTIDFGPAACLCSDGVYRRGKILVEYTGAYKAVGSMHTISFVDYYVNDNKVVGTKTVENKGLAGNGLPYYAVIVDGSLILSDGSGTITWKSARTRTWKEGYSTIAWNDDVYDITGSGNLTTAGGKKYAYTIVQAVNVALSCRWARSGRVELTPEGGSVRTLDYGNGDCDALATVTVDGKVTTINMR